MENSNNVWRTVGLILIGIIIGYVIGRFELTSVGVVNAPEDSEKTPQTEQAADSEASVTTAPTTKPATKIDISADDDPTMGNENASVTIIEFSDYECPFCARFYETMLPDLKADFVDTGKVHYVFRDFPLNIHPKAVEAANAAECAEDFGKYWEMHDLLFEKQTEWKTSLDLDATFIGYGKELGITSGSFADCVSSIKYKDEIEADKNDGVTYGVKGTPTLFINGQPLRGLPPSYEQLKSYLDTIVE